MAQTIYKSIERETLTPVFGTTCPPRGLSGVLRNVAYRHGEGKLRRWLTLMLADRIDVLEGRVIDLARGRLPRPFRERGLGSDPKARRRQQTKIAAAGIGALALLVLVLRRRR